MHTDGPKKGRLEVGGEVGGSPRPEVSTPLSKGRGSKKGAVEKKNGEGRGKRDENRRKFHRNEPVSSQNPPE